MGERVVSEAGAGSLGASPKVPTERFYEIQGKIMMELMMAGKGLAFTPVLNGTLGRRPMTRLTGMGWTTDVPTILALQKMTLQ